MMNKDGKYAINLGSDEERQIEDKNGDTRMLHSLGSVSYLKLEDTNHIHFKCMEY